MGVRELLVGEDVRVRLPGYGPFVGKVAGRASNGAIEVWSERGARWLVQEEHCRRVRMEWVEVED